MTESSEGNSDSESENVESKTTESKNAIRQNLSNFLNPGFPVKPSNEPDLNGALHLRMAQMELAHKMRMSDSNSDKASKTAPMRATPPPGGYGSAAGMFHMKRGDFGKKPQAAPPSKRSPYQQILAKSSSDNEETPTGTEDEVIEIPSEAEFKQNSVPKKGRGKRFQNPSL